jgi:hypothetical protein
VELLRIHNSEVASSRRQSRSERAEGAQHAITPHTRWSQLAPLRVRAAAVTLSCYGGPMRLNQPFCRRSQQYQQHRGVSKRAITSSAQAHAAGLYAFILTCNIVAVYELRVQTTE